MMIQQLGFAKDLFKWEKRLLFLFVATSLGRAAASMGTIYVIQEFLSAQSGVRSRAGKLIANAAGADAIPYVLAAMLLALYLISSWLNYTNRVVVQKTVKVLELGTLQKLMQHLLRLSVPYFDRESRADLIQAVRTDVTQLRVMIQAIASILLDGVTILGVSCVLLWLSPKLTLLVLVAIPIGWFPVSKALAGLRQRSLNVRSSGNLLLQAILQILSGIRTIRVYGGESTELKNTLKVGQSYFDEFIEMTRIRGLSAVLVEALSGCGIVVIIVFGGMMVKNGEFTWPSLVAFVMAVRALHGPVSNVHHSHSELGMLHASALRINEILAIQPEVQDVQKPLPMPRPPAEITFENVMFGYDGKTPVFKNLTFHLKAGETIGVVGPSGAGKSTLINLLARFYDPTQGHILFDGRDLRDYRMADLYRNYAIVTQEPFLFSATVQDNIRCSRKNATDEEVEDAARAASVHETILALPDGYQTLIGLGGRELSRGQAQRINVARAILKNAPILLLDEATSSLDSRSESEVQAALDGMLAGRTTFIVAHRMSTLRNVDRFLVLDQGTVVGFGTREELLESCELFATLWQLNNADQNEAADTTPYEVGIVATEC